MSKDVDDLYESIKARDEEISGLINELSAAKFLISDVIKYYEGKNPYNFSGLSEEDRANEAFDAWQGIYGRLKRFLSKKQE